MSYVSSHSRATSSTRPVLVLAPIGRDCELACTLLTGRGIVARACADMDTLCAGLGDKPGAVLITEEALKGDRAHRFASALTQQPQPVDVPVLALLARTSAARVDYALLPMLEAVDNLTLISRPIQSATLLRLVQAVLRGHRHRQARDGSSAYALAVQVYGQSPQPTLLVVGTDVVYANPAVMKLLGVTDAAQIAGRPVYRWIRGDFAPAVHACTTRVLSGAEPRSVMDQVWSRMDGAPLDVEVTVVSMPWGHQAGVAMFVRDASQSASNTTELMRQVDELRRADQRKDEFIALLAHELRNPLAPIQNAVHVLKIQPDLPDPKHYRWATDVIARQTRHVTRLVDDLLDIARITHGRVQLQKETIELERVINQALESIRPITEGRQQEVNYEPPAESIRLEADPTRLAQIIGNLLTNASRYTPVGGQIGISARQENTEAVIVVTDNGIGIAPEALAEIFEPFRQGVRPPDYARAGLGLGLALVRRLIDLHGGTVRAESAGVGRGSTFTVRLPALPSVTNDSRGQRRSAQGTNPQGLRILVLDDDANVAQSLAVTLSAMEHEVQVATTSVAALTSMRALDPELVFLDVDIPGVEGSLLINAMRRVSVRSDSRFVALVANDDEATRRRLLASGFSASLRKPPARETIESLLASLHLLPVS